MKRVCIYWLLSIWLLVGCNDIFEKDISRMRVTVIAPADNTQTTPGAITFLWHPLPDVDAYQLTVVYPTFESASRVVADTLVDGRRFTLDLGAGDYQWSIQPLNFGYHAERSVYNLKINTQDPELDPEQL